MKQSISNFLQFNNTNVLFTSVDGETYVAIRPICQALNLVYAGQLKTLKNDPILGPALYLRTIQVPNLQARQYTCIPEKYVYGWLFSIKSDKPEFVEFKKECYDLLYNHFHGVIGRRKELLLGQAEVALKIDELKTKLYQSIEYKELIELEAKKKIYSKEMSQVDKMVLNQSEFKFE
jgi:hypothetical protein